MPVSDGSSHDPALSPPGQSELPRLPPPGHSGQKGRSSADQGGLLAPLLTIGSSLAVVLGLFFVFAWTMRRTAPGGVTVLPSEVVEVLGRAPLTQRQQLHLLRCGRKLLLVSVCPEGVETLTEIAEPEEVDRLLGLCRQSHPQSASAAFRQVFQQFTGERTGAAFLSGARPGRSHRSLEDTDA
jgi:flagellar biogenesis protein FliO